MNLKKIKRAIISVYDKSNLKNLLPTLKRLNIEILSSGGTFEEIKKMGYKCTEISNFTGFKEMLDGRVKTLHPKIHAGILSIRNSKKHKKDLKKFNFSEIDLVVVNFYPFESIIKKYKSENKITEFIDIGGPTLLRGAAKNFNFVTAVTDNHDYVNLIKELKKFNGSTSLKFRKYLASKAFGLTAYYDSVISNQFNKNLKIDFPIIKTIHGITNTNLRYGENPHQKASLYKIGNAEDIIQLNGKKMSYNNYCDIYAALSISKSFKKNEGTVIVKHTNPSGVSVEKNSIKSYRNALNCDPVSAFGGILACNYLISENLAKQINKKFFENYYCKWVYEKCFENFEKK